MIILYQAQSPVIANAVTPLPVKISFQGLSMGSGIIAAIDVLLDPRENSTGYANIHLFKL